MRAFANSLLGKYRCFAASWLPTKNEAWVQIHDPLYSLSAACFENQENVFTCFLPICAFLCKLSEACLANPTLRDYRYDRAVQEMLPNKRTKQVLKFLCKCVLNLQRNTLRSPFSEKCSPTNEFCIWFAAEFKIYTHNVSWDIAIARTRSDRFI